MRPERKKTLWLMVGILCFGMFIGALAVALVNKTRHYRASWRKEGKEAFIQKIMGVIDADSVQARQIRPHILQAISSIDSLQKKTDDQVRAVVVDFEKDIKPLVTEEQMEQLRRFHSKAREPKD